MHYLILVDSFPVVELFFETLNPYCELLKLFTIFLALLVIF